MRPSLATRLVRTPIRNAAAATVTPAAAALLQLDTYPVPVNPTPSKTLLGDVWFSSSAPYALPDSGPEGDHKPPDERTLKLGKSMHTLLDSVLIS